MRLEWIDDILAVLEEGSLAQAAEKRLLTQSAFTRRVRVIEDNVGATLFNRDRKPVSLMPGVAALEPELRELSTRLHRLRHALKTSGAHSPQSLSFVCQHALTATIAPQVVSALRRAGEVSVRVSSGNQDECLMQLLSREVDFAIMYALPGDTAPEISTAFEAVTLGEDRLIPVCSPSLRGEASGAAIPLIAYPPGVFLGQVFDRMISPRLPQGVTTVPTAETALTLAMQQLALSDIGIAWLPYSLVAAPLAEGGLIRVDDLLPAQPLTITMVRLHEGQTEQANATWRDLAEHLQISTSEPRPR